MNVAGTGRWFALGLWLGMPWSPLQGQLALPTPTVEVKPSPELNAIEVAFNFTNSSDRSVQILGVESSCGCLKAELDADRYAAGASGVGKAEFQLSSIVGRQEKTLKVLTDHPDQPAWVVPFVIDIPAVIEIEPRTLQWWIGEPPTPKTYTVRMVGETPIRIQSITSTRESMTFEMETIQEGREYRITTTPTSTDESVLGLLKIETDSEVPKFQRQLAYFSIFRKPAKAKTEEADQP